MSNVISRVLKITTNTASATAFTVDLEGEQYLVTARHVLPNPEETYRVDLSGHHGHGWLDVMPVAGVQEDVDIAVGRLTEPVTPKPPLPATLNGMAYGQDVYFYGYPYGLASTAKGAERLPLIKRALLSGVTREASGAHVLYLDGFNNPGFSGGPVVFVPQTTGRGLTVGAVISGYRTDPLEVVDVESQKAVGTFVRGNSGIIVAYSIEHALAALGIDPASQV